MMLRIIPFLIFLLLLGSGCTKPKDPTIYNITVTDRKTGEPVKHAFVEWCFYEAGNDLAPCQSQYQYTDDNGFVSNTRQVGSAGGVVTINHSDYLTLVPGLNTHYSIQGGQINDLDLTMIPKDGKIALKVVNETGTHDLFYLFYSNDIISHEHLGGEYLKPYPLKLAQGAVFYDTLCVPTDAMTDLDWDFHPITFPTAFVDSVFVMRGQIVNVEIHY